MWLTFCFRQLYAVLQMISAKCISSINRVKLRFGDEGMLMLKLGLGLLYYSSLLVARGKSASRRLLIGWALGVCSSIGQCMFLV